MSQAHILKEIRADLVSFADTHSPIDVSESGAEWLRHSEKRRVAFVQRPADALPAVRTNGVVQNFGDYLASPDMADLEALAEAMYLGLPEQGRYVESTATAEAGTNVEPVEDLLTRQANDPPFGATRVVFLRGAAGAGKTCALRQLARRQAAKYLDHEAKFLYLYIDAQARSLARLDDAVALVLQDLNARFTYRALATLTRHQLVVPIIDGFDELLGTGEGTDALDALSLFLTRLQGCGVVLASARSSYFDFHDFRDRAARMARMSNASFELVSIDLQPWTDEEMMAYLKKAGVPGQLGVSSPREALARLREAYDVGDNGDLFATPFFLAAAAEALSDADATGSPESAEPVSRPIARIIDRFIRREVGKHRDATNAVLMDRGGHERFLETLAEEMWWQERRELDGESVRVVAELLGESLGVRDRDLRAFVEHASSYAFLQTQRTGSTGGQPRLAFAHEVYYSFFLARFLARQFAEGADISDLLGRSKMGPTVGAEFGECVKEGRVDAARVIRSLAERRAPFLSRETNRENAATLYAGIVPHVDDVDEFVLTDAAFIGSDLRGTRARNVRVKKCDFVDVNFTGANWDFSGTEGSIWTRLHVDHLTKLRGLSLEIGTDLVGISFSDGEDPARMVYDPSGVTAICEAVGIASRTIDEPETAGYSQEARAVVETLDKFLRCAERLFHISDGDLARRGFRNRRAWPETEKLLLQHGLLEVQTIQRKGTGNKVRILAFPPNRIAEGETGVSTEPRIRAFWQEVKSL